MGDADVVLLDSPPTVFALAVEPGWNLVGVAAETTAPGAPLVQAPAWTWNGVTYTPVARLLVGRGYWFYCLEPGIWQAPE
jgi:cytochrome c-type biogenesis protein CcmH/NrfG